MNRISVSQLRSQFYVVLRRVERGESFVITRYGQPIARLVPFSGSAE